MLKAVPKKRRPLAIIVIAIVLSAAVFAILMGRIEPVNIIINRFQTEDMTTGRSELWLWYLEFLQQHPFNLVFGIGTNSNMINGRAAHNFFLEIVYHLGLIGTAIYFIPVCSALFMRQRLATRVFYNYFPIVLLTIISFFLNELFDYYLPFYLIFCWMVLNTQLPYCKNLPTNFTERKEMT